MCRTRQVDKPLAGFLTAVVLVAAALPPAHAFAQSAEDQSLDRFLTRLGLVDLQMQLHEQTLRNDARAASHATSAKRLADLYAAALLGAESADRAAELQRRVDDLLARFPDAGTSALKVSLAQAEYQRAEKLILAWLDDPRANDSRTQAGQILEKIAPTLDAQHKTLHDSAARMAEQLDREKVDRARAELEVAWQREQGVAARAGYLAAWAHYYAGLCAQPTPLAEPHFHAARREFRDVLGLADVTDYEKVEQDALGLEPLARARAVVGLGLSEAALAQAFEADQVFRWLEGATVNPTIREQSDYWRLQSRLNVWRWSEALEVAAARATALSGAATPGKVSFFVALVRAGYLTPKNESFGAAREARESPDASQRRRFADLGLQGLLRLRQISLLRELVARYDIPVDAEAPLPLVWARADQWFRDAEQDHDAAKYQQVAQLLSTALARTDAASDVATAGRCRWTLAWCRYRLKEFDAAAKLFQQAAVGLREHDAKTAVESAWMAFASYQQLAADQPTARSAAIDALHTLQRDFPNTPRAQQAGLQLARLQQSAESPEDALKTLEKIKPDDPQYATARYEICRLRHQLWTKATKGGRAGEGKEAAAQVLSAVESFWQLQSRRPMPTADDDDRSLKALLLALDVLAADEQQLDQPEFAQLLQRAQTSADRLPATSASLPEYHYRRLQSAQRQGDATLTHAAAAWLAKHAAGSPYELTALVLRARQLDEAIAKVDAAEAPGLQREAAQVYARLVALWGDSPQAITTKKNTFVANSKLAHYLYETGQYVEASARMEKTLAAYPQDKALLRRAALAAQRAGQSAAALDKWRTLLAGLEKGSHDWFEAKLGQLECLVETDPDKAAPVFDQFKVLYPELGGEAWKSRFEQVARRVASRPRTAK